MKKMTTISLENTNLNKKTVTYNEINVGQVFFCPSDGDTYIKVYDSNIYWPAVCLSDWKIYDLDEDTEVIPLNATINLK